MNTKWCPKNRECLNYLLQGVISVDDYSFVDQRKVKQYLYEMSLFPIFNGKIESLNIPHFIDEKCFPLDPRQLLSYG